MIEGGHETLEAALNAIEAAIPVLVFAGSGKAADFIAAAYDRRERPSVLVTLYYIYVLLSGNAFSCKVHKICEAKCELHFIKNLTLQTLGRIALDVAFKPNLAIRK